MYNSGWWEADEPKLGADILLPCGWGREEGCRCPFGSNAPSIQSFNWVSFICLRWPLLFSISPSSFPSLIYFFVPRPAPSSSPSSSFHPKSKLPFLVVWQQTNIPESYCDFRHNGLLFSKPVWWAVRRQDHGVLHFQQQINIQKIEFSVHFSVIFPVFFFPFVLRCPSSPCRLCFPFGFQLVCLSFHYFVLSHYDQTLLLPVSWSQCPCTQW